MTFATVLTIDTAKVACNAIVDLLNAGGTLEIQNAAPANDAICTFTMPAPTFDAAADVGGDAVAAMLAPTSAFPDAHADMIADHFVVKNSVAAEVWRGSCGTTASFDMQLDSTTLDDAIEVTLSTFVFRMPVATTCP